MTRPAAWVAAAALLLASTGLPAAAFPAHPHAVAGASMDLEALDRRIDAAFHGGTRRELRRLLFKSVDLDPRPAEVRTLAFALSMVVSEDDRVGETAFVYSDADFADLGGLEDPVLAAIARARARGTAKARAVYQWALKQGAPDPKRYEDYGDALFLEEGWRLRMNGREAEAVPLFVEAKVAMLTSMFPLGAALVGLDSLIGAALAEFVVVAATFFFFIAIAAFTLKGND